MSARWVAAGTFDPPPQLVDDIVAWGERAMASHVLSKLAVKLPERQREVNDPGRAEVFHQGDRNTLVEYTRLRRWAEGVLGGQRSVPTARDFHVDIAGWKYLPMLRERLGRDPQSALDETPLEHILVTLDLNKPRDGGWRPAPRRMYLHYPFDAPTMWALDRDLARFRSLVRHECVHVGQAVLEMLSGVEEVGLPSPKMREPGYNLNGHPEGRPLGTFTKEEQEEHALREVEFYSRLGDEVAAFALEAPKIPLDGRRKAFRIWVGVERGPHTFRVPGVTRPTYPVTVYGATDFFAALKEKNTAKWRKAVGEFMVALEREGIRV